MQLLDKLRLVSDIQQVVDDEVWSRNLDFRFGIEGRLKALAKTAEEGAIFGGGDLNASSGSI
jgi:hypothetical protein